MASPHLTSRAIAAASLLLLAVSWSLARSPGLVESIFSSGIFPWVAFLQGLALGWLPLSVAEVLVFVLPLTILAVAMAKLCRRPDKTTFAGLIWQGSALLLAVLTSSYLLWGLNYSRPPLEARLGWEVNTTPEPESLLHTAHALVETLNAERPAGGGERPWGVLNESWSAMDGLVRDGLRKASSRLGQQWDPPPGVAKRVVLSRGMSYLGISGIYFPWTGEANVNVDVPQVQLPHVLAHERAHQLGAAAEDEANFVAFVACFNSPDPRLRYSAALFGFQQIAAQLASSKQADSAAPWSRLAEGVREDLRRIRRYWQAFDGPAERVAARVNDRYLRAHGISGGIRSYSESVRLILGYWQNVVNKP